MNLVFIGSSLALRMPSVRGVNDKSAYDGDGFPEDIVNCLPILQPCSLPFSSQIL